MSTIDSKQGTQVYINYDVCSPPPTPGPEWVRFVLISDTHSQTTDIPDGDVLLHAGDLTTLGQPDDLEAQVKWLTQKIFTCGNHDFSACTAKDFYSTRGRALNTKYKVKDSPDDVERAARILSPSNLGANLKYLESESFSFAVDRKEVRHYPWKVFGSPWSPEFENWAWNYTRGPEAKAVHSAIPADVDVLITHTPPFKLGGLDSIHDGTPVGCEELTRRLTAEDGDEEAIRPRLHVFGHIHEARGTHLLTQGQKETLLVNAALVEYDQEKWQTERKFSYTVVCKPVIVDLRVPAPSSL
ncbi:uncharacterized protein UTRI_03066 [Ustilago trichophora]|uniref:Calcineurin-like phosphoesterase domain-containing protein n=1 Tax=Ustilago trichophora TaxID=86804 RepID=A0A5C3E847_9BASI|nr:uncharacterized protein UTRI_03066 [Ustilago trichophora]